MQTGVLFGIILILPFLKGATPASCSCYSIHEDGLNWPAARKTCQYYGGDLVSMETERELQVLKDHIQNRTNRFNDSWHIGLRIDASGNWTWVSGKPLTTNRWQSWQPRERAPYTVMARNYPPGTMALFHDVRRDILAGYICEKPSDCSRNAVICKDTGRIIQIRTSTRAQSSESSWPPSTATRKERSGFSQLPTRKTIAERRKTQQFIMVEKVQPPSGYIHWTVTVIPLGSVIVVLFCVIVFLLWRLKQKRRKRNGADITVNDIHYDVHTRSILNAEGRTKNCRGSKHTRVHFEEPKKCESTKDHTLEQAKNNANGSALYNNPVDRPIPRRLAIRIKNSKELECKYPPNQREIDAEKGDGNTSKEDDTDYTIPRGSAMRRENSKELECKYPLNKSENDDENGDGNASKQHDADYTIQRRLAIRRKNSKELECKYPLNKSGDDVKNGDGNPDLCGNTSNEGDKIDRNLWLHKYHLVKDFEEPSSTTESEDGGTEKTAAGDCPDDELSYLEIIP